MIAGGVDCWVENNDGGPIQPEIGINDRLISRNRENIMLIMEALRYRYFFS